MNRVLPLVIALVISACSRGTPAAANDTNASTPAPSQTAGSPASVVKPVPAQLPDVLARVNGDDIRKTDFEKALRSIEAQAGATVPADQRDRIYRDVLNQLIGYRLLAQEVAVRKVTIPDATVDQQITAMRQKFPTEEAFRQTLERQQTTLDQMRADVRLELAIEKMLEGELSSKVSVKPEEITEFYQKNPDKFQQGERVRASHILITVPQNADAAAKTAARNKASEVLKEVKGGKDFAALAKLHSQDPGSATNGGDLGFFGRGQMVGPFDQAAFTLKPGEVSDLVETQFGYHIIKVVEKEPSKPVALDAVRPQIQQFLENQQKQAQTRIFVEGLKSRGKVEIYI